jgi:hypothetical protein
MTAASSKYDFRAHFWSESSGIKRPSREFFSRPILQLNQECVEKTEKIAKVYGSSN